MKQGERGVSVAVCDQTVMVSAQGFCGGQQEAEMQLSGRNPQFRKLQANFDVHKSLISLVISCSWRSELHLLS